MRRDPPIRTNLAKVKGTTPKQYADDRSRVVNKKLYDKNYDRIFGGKGTLIGRRLGHIV